MIANIAHRGGAGLWPENTLGAFSRALALGCAGMELDVHLTRDGTVVVFHDEALKPDLVRDATGAWLEPPTPLIKDLTLADLARFDVGRAAPGSPTARRHPEQLPLPGERIPTLAEVVRLTREFSPGAKLWIEIKTALLEPQRGADPRALADAVLDVLAAEGFAARAVLIGFDWRALVHAKAQVPGIETRFTTLPQSWFANAPPPAEHGPPPGPALAALRAAAATGAPWQAGFHPQDHGGLLEAIKAAGGSGWFPYHADLTPETAARARALGLSLAAWTVDDPDEMARLIALGVDAICTDRPDRLKRLLDAAAPG